jgi:hypothetical protein
VRCEAQGEVLDLGSLIHTMSLTQSNNGGSAAGPGANPAPASDARLDELLGRIKAMAAKGTNGGTTPTSASDVAKSSTSSVSSSTPAAAKPAVAKPNGSEDDLFVPREPSTFREAMLNEAEAENIALKYLLSAGSSSGRQVADQMKLPFKMIDEMLFQLKTDQLVVYRNSALAGDYQYQLTDMGREKAKRLTEHCTYYGAAPVSLRDYIASVSAQSLTKRHPSAEDLARAFEDLKVNEKMLRRLGPAINSGRGLFLFGAPGNGKTSIAERITRAFGDTVWIPRSISIDGEIIRLFDPSNHQVAPLERDDGIMHNVQVDRRWIRIQRPTIIAGGELTMDSLEVTLNRSTGISEAPLQLKSNCGTLVIDDFGRQRMSTDELLNRWIVPLEKRYDFLNLPNGKKIQVPFDQLIIFSTNLEPKQLVDDAFLRRIPYKIEVQDPTEQEYRDLMELMAGKLGFDYDVTAVDYLVEKHYKRVKRPFRCCQPRDLLMQIKNLCIYDRSPMVMSPATFDFAVENYFAVM